MMRPQDVATAAAVGADAIGMVFYSAAPRHVTIEQAKKMIDVLPPFVTPVGLFVDSPAEEVAQISRQLNLGHVQLHGRESPELVSQLKSLNIVKAVHVDAKLRGTLANWRAAIADMQLTNIKGILLETGATGAAGGTGAVNDWEAIAAAQRSGAFDGLPPLIVAGGLTPENVGTVIEQLRPFAVDVSSGIESSRGVKSAEKMRAFVAAVGGSSC